MIIVQKIATVRIGDGDTLMLVLSHLLIVRGRDVVMHEQLSAVLV